MHFISWNVNGLRAAVRKGWLDFFHQQKADFFAVQEIKLQEGQINLELDGYEMYWNYAERKGYAGVAIFTKHSPISVQYGLNEHTKEKEGRVITLEYASFYFVTVYTPNSQRSLAKLDNRMEWDKQFYKHVTNLNKIKPVIICGDLNVAHQPIDLRNNKQNIGNSGFTLEERENLTKLLKAGFIDTLRYKKPTEEGLYTWWSYMKTVRERNIGWRIDYFLISECWKQYISEAKTHPEIYGSDHCPISLTLSI